jgi:hypothetical protein
MNIVLPLEEMSVEEKLQVMETLWDDLSRQGGKLQPPNWHGEELARREADMTRGEETFEDWETAKQSIEQTIK